MAYQRKTEDEFNIEQLTCSGWEEVSCYSTRREARECLKDYRQNQPEHPVRIKAKRVKIETR
jgi:hypothetical protein